MRHVSSLPVFTGLFALVLAGCSGGNTDPAASVRVRCSGGEAFCLYSCDLGCTQTGCAITEIAENQRLKFTFSNALDMASVNTSSVSIRTMTGVPAEGDLLVTGSEVVFKPRVRTVNGVSTFGFQRNESYIIALSGGPSAPFGVRSVSGDRLTREFACTVVASRGILDDDQQPPRAEMVAPTNLNAAPLVPTVVLRFSELIDTAPLRGSLTTASPIRYTLRRAITNANGLVCDRDAQGTMLEGIPRLTVERVGDHDVTVVTFTPTVQLPGTSCVEVLVTADLRDLSGRQAIPALFEFFTEAGISTPITISEPFASPAKMDVRLSGGTWLSGARPGLIGGDGRHGSFDPSISGVVSSTEFTWNTTLVTVPASKSLEGIPYDVTDGKFYFTDFLLPAGTQLNFVGPVAPQIYVRGKADILGTITLNGAAMTNFNARGGTLTPAPFVAGQAGGAPGAGGGRGGRGGDEYQHLAPAPGPGTLLPLASNHGQRGDPVQLLAGHAYVASGVNTGGAGSLMNPSSTSVVYQPVTTPTQQAPIQQLQLVVYRSFYAIGGGGGGFNTPGTVGTMVPNGLINISTATGNLGPGGAAGLAFNLFPYPPLNPPPGYSSLNHFMVGGSGGGGGGTHAFGTITVPTTADVFVAGSGGSGGGGAFALRAGNTLTVAGSASLQAKGGAGVQISGRDPNGAGTNANWGVSCSGGGGSGGSFLLQSGADLPIAGTIDTRGGNGSSTGNIAIQQFAVVGNAGAGATGTYRLEAVTPITFGGTSFPAHNPATHIGTLTDRDPLSGCLSLWYSTNLIFPPQWLSYELDVDNDGNGTVDITYTDTGALGTQMANDPNGPVMIKFQGSIVSQGTGLPVEGTVGPWRQGIGSGGGPGIALDSATGMRFMMTFNRGLFPDCVVRGLRVNART